MTDTDRLTELQTENARLIALLDSNGIEWRVRAKPTLIPAKQIEQPLQQFNTDDKIALYRSLFRGRNDVYPIRWESKTGKSGYAPACANEWRPGVCESLESNALIAVIVSCYR